MVPLSGLISVAFLGHLTEIRHLAGVALSTILFNYIYRTLGFLRMGTTGVTAQAMGRDDRAAALLAGMRNGILALGLGLVILVLQHPLRDLGFALLSATHDVEAAGQAYYDARIWAAPATLLNFVLIGWFLGLERSGKVLLMSVIGNAINIGLDYLLITQWGWDSAGAGFATAISQYVMALVGLMLVSQEIQISEVKAIAPQLLDLVALKDCLVLNGDIFIRTFAFLSAFSIFTSLSAAMGTTVLAENALLLQVVTLTVYLIDGLAFATESLAGNFKGKGAIDQLLPLVRVSGQTSLAIGLVFALMFVLFPDPLFGLMTNHTEVLHQVDRYVFWLLPVLGFGSIAFMLDGYFLGLAEGTTLRNTALAATLIGFVPVAIAAWHLQSGYLLWLAMSLFMVVRVAMLGIQVPRTLRVANGELARL
jgi:MATE family multidrug resistance protein